MSGIFNGFKRGLKQGVVDFGRGAEDLVYTPSTLTKITRKLQDLWRNEVQPELEKVGTTVQDFQKKEVEPKIEKIGETVQELLENNLPKIKKIGETVQELWKDNVPRKRSLDSPEDEYSTGESPTGSPTGSPRGKKQCISLEQYHNSNNNNETNSSLEEYELLNDLLKTYHQPKGDNNDDWG